MDRDKENELFERYLALDPEDRHQVFPAVFGWMRSLAESGTRIEQGAAAMFFATVRKVIDDKEDM